MNKSHVRYIRQSVDHKLFGDVLATKRAELNRSQVSVANQVGHSGTWLSYYERGLFMKIPVLSDLKLLCSILDLNPVELLYECGFISKHDLYEFSSKLSQASVTSRKKAA